MEKRQISIILIVGVCLLMGLASTVGEENQEERKPIGATLTERLTSLLYVSSPSLSPSALSNWDKFKTLLHQAHAYFFPPNLESNSEANQGTMSSTSGGSGGAGEKVKEAVAKSLEKGKESVEDSAKSAAKIGGETLQKASEKLKKSLSKGEEAQPHQKSQEL